MPTQPNLTPAEDNIGFALPSRRDEAWKWTDVRKIISGDGEELANSCVPVIELPDGVTLTDENFLKPWARTQLKEPMLGIANYFAKYRNLITVPSGVQPAKPIKISGLNSGNAFIDIVVEEGAKISLIESHSGADDDISNVFLRIKIEEGGALTRTILHNDESTHVRICTSHIIMETGAKLSQYALSFGGALTRLETRIHGEGADLSAELGGAYLLSGKRHCDMTSHITLAQPDAHIRQSVKGVADDKSRGVFQGKFHVERAAQHTDAEMRHDALMLSETAQIRSKPELEIYADDVACAHGNTIGQLDESALFYMRQRGIPLKSARALLMQAFVNDVFDDMEDEDLQADILAQISAWLEG